VQRITTVILRSLCGSCLYILMIDGMCLLASGINLVATYVSLLQSYYVYGGTRKLLSSVCQGVAFGRLRGRESVQL
jgi:hypothetical protein